MYTFTPPKAISYIDHHTRLNTSSRFYDYLQLPFVVLSCPVLSCLLVSCLVFSCRGLPWFVLSCLVLSCLVVFCLVESSLVSSWLFQSGLISSCLCLVFVFYFFLYAFLVISYFWSDLVLSVVVPCRFMPFAVFCCLVFSWLIF